MTTEQIQHLLCYLGYDPGGVDGQFGTKTMEAVKSFQRDFGGLSVDGDPGTATQKALKHAVAYGIEKATTEDSTAVGGDSNASAKTDTFWDEIQYFTREEFRCKCGGKYCDGFPAEPAEATVRAVDEIRRRLGVPVTISSGLRCATHNANEGGVSTSRHMTGLAADLHSSKTPAEMKAVAEEVLGNAGGLGVYSWGIHVDTGAYSRWTG